jgi:thiol-disulfide isomerase/thioredoxin
VRVGALFVLTVMVAACAPPDVSSPAARQSAPEVVQFAACGTLAQEAPSQGAGSQGAGQGVGWQQAGSQLPDVSVPCFTGGEPVRVKRLRGPLVINFWASWCPPCIKELPAFQRLAQSGKVPVMGVATDDRRDAALSLATDLGVTFPTLFDAKGEFRRARGEAALPLTLFVTASGEVSSYSGPALTDETLGALVAQRLGGGT